MTFKIRKYYKTIEDCFKITLIQIIPCINVGWITDLVRDEKRFNFAIGWLFWIFEISFIGKEES